MMNPHPDQMHTAAMLQREELLRVAARERLADTACERRPPFPPTAVWTLVAGIGAKLMSAAQTLLAPSGRALPALWSEQS